MTDYEIKLTVIVLRSVLEPHEKGHGQKHVSLGIRTGELAAHDYRVLDLWTLTSVQDQRV